MSGIPERATPEANSAREEILARIRAGLPNAMGEIDSVESSHASIARPYRRTASLDRARCVALFLDRLLEYDAEVVEITSEEEIAGAWLLARLQRR